MGETPHGPAGPLRVVGPTERGDGFLMRLEGEFDLAGAPAFDEAASRVPASGRLIIDLRELDYLDSSGLAALLRTDARLRAGGGALECVASPEGGIWRLFELTSISEQIRISEELPE